MMDLFLENLSPTQTLTDNFNIRIAGRLAWERKEMGGIEFVQFAHRNNTPIVPFGHCGHPVELLKRGYIDGKGWPKNTIPTWENRIKLSKWPDGDHWYAHFENGEDITDKDGNQKWDTQDEAMKASKWWMEKYKKL